MKSGHMDIKMTTDDPRGVLAPTLLAYSLSDAAEPVGIGGSKPSAFVDDGLSIDIQRSIVTCGN